MSETVLWTLDIDGSPALAALDEIASGMQALDDQVNQLAGSADQLSVLDDILTAIQDQTSIMVASFTDLNESVQEVASGVGDAVTGIEELNTSLDEVAASALDAANAAQEAADSVLTLGTDSEEASGMMGGLQSAMGPLTMIAGAALMAGGAFAQMGMDGQKGEALLRGMAGASSDDINALETDAEKLGVSMKEASAGFYEVESAGYSGKDAIIEFDAAERLALGGQAQAQDVMSGLTAVMHDYGAGAQQASQYTDDLAEAQFLGKQSMQDLATSIGPLAAAGSQAGYSFEQVAAAEATMTQINPSVQRDTQQMRALFQSLDPALGKIEAAVKKTGVSFDMAHYKSLDLNGQLQYLAQIAGGTNTEAFHTLTGGVQGSTAAVDLMIGGGATFQKYLQDMQHDTGQTNIAFQSWENTIPGALDHVGASLSVFATKMMDAIGPTVGPIIAKLGDAIGNMADFVSSHITLLMPVFAGLAAVIGGAVIGAIVALLASIGPILLILVGIGVVVAGVVAAFQHWSQIMAAVRSAIPTPVLSFLHNLLQQVGGFLASTFVPIWQELVSVYNTELKPAFSQLMTALAPLIPAFEAIGVVIGGVLFFTLVTLIGVIGGVVRAFAMMLLGVTTAIGGIAKIFSGLVTIVGGIVQLIVDILTGHFNKVGGDLQKIWQGIVTVAQGAMQFLQGVMEAALGSIIAFVEGFAQSVLGFFENLGSTLTGQTIPQLVNGIVHWFQQLPTMALQAVASLGAMMGTYFYGLASQAVTWGADIINSIASGIKGVIGNITSAVNSVGNAIKSVLHFSKPDTGPLVDIDTWMPDMGTLLAEGLTAQKNKIRTAASDIAQTLATSANPTINATVTGSPLAGAGGSAGNQQQVVSLLTQIATTLNQMHSTLQQQTGGGTAFSGTLQTQGITNAQELYNFLQSIGGYSYYQDLKRGGYGIG